MKLWTVVAVGLVIIFGDVVVVVVVVVVLVVVVEVDVVVALVVVEVVIAAKAHTTYSLDAGLLIAVQPKYCSVRKW